MEKIRLQKYLSQAWICSRRKAEEYILDWLVKVNWIVAEIWQSITPWEDKIELLQKAIDKQKKLVYYKLNKPRGIVTTCAQNQEKNIIDIINIKERVFPIWRLDKDTTWLILLTNDWKMSNWLFILWSYTKKAQVNRISSGKFSIIITEWRNRQIRRMVEKVWFKVKKLKRIRIENIKLWNLETWEYIPLTIRELNNLFERLWIKKD